MSPDDIEKRLRIVKQLKFNQFEEPVYSKNIPSTQVRKKKGIYYTPPDITSYICFQTLTSKIFQFLNSKFPDKKSDITDLNSTQLQELFQWLRGLKILDPACGAGIFLIHAAEILLQYQKMIFQALDEKVNESSLREDIIQNNIYGLDLFEDAVMTTKNLLSKWANQKVETKSKPSSKSNLDSNIYVGNALIGWLYEVFADLEVDSPTQVHQKFLNSVIGESLDKIGNISKVYQELKPFHWRLRFEQIINEGGFDIIVGNPPYVFIRGKNFSPLEKKFYKSKYLSNYDSIAKGKARQSRKINTFSLFIIRSLDLLKSNGFLGFIVPNTILRTTTNDFIRQFILENTHIQEIVDLRGGVFEGITASTILIFLQKTLKSRDPTLINYNVRDLLNYQFRSHYLNQARFQNNPVFAFNIHLDSELELPFSVLKKNTFPLGAVTKEIIEGIVCRKSDNLFTEDSNHPLAKKLLRGKDISRYQINWPAKQYILYATDTSLTRTKLHRSRPQWVFESPEKFLAQRIGGGLYPIKLVIDNSQFYTFASINNIIFKKPLIYADMEYLPKYILASLNSKLINTYYLLNYSNLSSLTVNISKTFLESLPIKQVDLPTQHTISKLADYLLFFNQYPEKAAALIQFFDLWILDSLIYEIYMKDLIKTNLIELLPKYIPELPSTFPAAQKFQFFLQILLQIQQDPHINQTITNIKQHPTIKKIENIFENRDRLLKEKR